ncbi:hypothetical protein AAL_06295 [Moelleriella libera RCEF 2490]|uniref:Uncharacterized protein n=1 Tax=Moelleriella libera RCEF 2490 TaxID=1081109 RepID=A0A167Z2S8_9HYPO|nr:hypothetical protein AAL_06295 [Moelleriella libera RCEF 2490]
MPSSLKSLVNEGTETGTTASASPTEHNGPNGHILPTDCEAERQAHTTEDHKGQSCEGDVSPSPPPVEVPAFDWEDFETRYMRALQDADEREREILREAENLSKVSYISRLSPYGAL